MTAREQILATIARNKPQLDPYPHPLRDYRQTSTLTPAQRTTLLEERLHDYDAGVSHATLTDLPRRIAHILAERGKMLLALPTGIPSAWLPDGVQFMEDSRTTHDEIDQCQGVLTTAALAIALTGTIVLQHAPPSAPGNGQGRRALTLLPDYHLCIVRCETIVETVPEALAVLAPTAHLATTFFSGPSATADIEMTRIKGVHGPRFVDVILLG